MIKFETMNRWCTILLLLVCSFKGYAQYDPEKVNKKAMKLYLQAMEKALYDDFPEGIRLLKEAVRIDAKFADAILSIAGMYGEMKRYDSAITYYERARSIDAVYFKEYNLPYSINIAGKGEFEHALTAVDEFLSIPDLNEQSLKAANYRKKSYQFALDYAKEKLVGDYKFEPRNMGDSINSPVSEYYPTITLDGKNFIFTRRLDRNEDFFGASLEGNSWTKARGLTGNINSSFSEGAQNISQDGQILIFTGCNFPEGMGSCDLYISYLTPDGWSTPENLGFIINTESWESAPSLSPDKRDLYFASNRPGGYGASDIYVCRRLPNGRFSEPENLGPEVNTAGEESCPFIHADNQSLYFTSNGHPGYGGDDLFMVKKGPKKTWGKPVNLGYPINTIENEGSLIIAADGKTAYYASDRSDSRGGLDLYTFELRTDLRPAKTLWVKGNVFDKKTKKGLPSAVELTDIATNETITKLQTDEKGNYLITLPVGRDYAFNVNRKGYLFFSENFPLSQKSPDSTYAIDIPLQPIEANATIVLKNIFFETKMFDLKPESTTELDKVVQLLKDNPTLKIEISGHTDNVGKPEDNLKLSEARAGSVVKYLVTKGIVATRLISKGYGASVPVAPNINDEGRALNRRTELKVISQ
jgi:outer membrane protein OmpA-like peptidoglycan-associated protein/tetratricopeptide (TPR) repeat protein